MSSQRDARSPRQLLDDALLPPLRFAARGDFAHVSRLAGFESHAGLAIRRARGEVDEALLNALAALATGFDASDEPGRQRRARAMYALMTPAPQSAAADIPALPGSRPREDTAQRRATSPSGAGAAKGPSPEDVFAQSVRLLRGVGAKRAAELEQRGLHTVGDLLYTLPRTWEDRRTARRIGDLQGGMLAVVSGTVVAAGPVGFGGRGRRYEVTIDDGTGHLRLLFFHFRQGEMQKRFPRGAVITAVGEVQSYGPRMQMVHPRVSAGTRLDELGGIHPAYPELRGLHPLALSRCVAAALDRARQAGVRDPLPVSVRTAGDVMPLLDACAALHAPPDTLSPDELRALVERRSPAHRRLAFEELFVLGVALALRRRAGHADAASPLAPSEGEADALARLLPFAPTRAQARAIHEIGRDLAATVPMARLLQGDVGAGKTAVAAAACLRAVRAGYQAAFMAPTELLAEQHGRTLKRLFSPLGVRVEVITGAMGKKARRLAEARLVQRDLDVVVGTQALLSEGVDFARLGLCVVDEQHRFGVVQRAALRDKGPMVDGTRRAPHLLVMTATPIPRSLALTVYGDLAVSVLDELPPGRTPIVTTATGDSEVAVQAVAETVARGERAFVVYPLIDDSDVGHRAATTADLAAAMRGYDDLRARFGDCVGLVHGRIASAEREVTMARFARGDLKILVATTVIEVGVDVPEATLMVVENAERFGLAQLHQLRGRVGRGRGASRCILVVGNGGGEDAMARVRVLTETTDGFRIAEEDLAIRGPGDILGTRQAGVPTLAFADLVRHAPLIERARGIADALVAADPALAAPGHEGLRALVLERYATRLALTAAG